MSFDPEILTPAPDEHTLVFTAAGIIVGELLLADRLPMIRGLDYTVSGAQITFLPAAYPLSATPGAPPAATLLRLFRQVGPPTGPGDLAICNLALLRVGVASPIASFAALTKEARVCNTLYASMRDKLLEVYNWTFGRKRWVLSPSASLVRDGWDFIYDIPADCLVPRRIWNGQLRSRPEDEIPFAVEPDDAGSSLVLLCNEDSSTTAPVLLGTKRVTDPAIFSNLFADALAWLMADELVVPLTVSPSAAATLDGKFEKAFALGVTTDAKKAQDPPPPESTFIAARGLRSVMPRPPRLP